MFAVIKSGGKQHRVSVGDKLKVEKLDQAEGSQVVFDQVLMVEDEGRVQVGSPLVKEASVKATIEKHGRGRKIIVFKFKRRKGYHKKQGHRQDYTLLRIDEVVAGGEAV